jgi:hypothetical protein
VFAVLTWQAKRGQSVLHPDAPTVVAFAAVVVLALAGAATAVMTARRQAVEELVAVNA